MIGFVKWWWDKKDDSDKFGVKVGLFIVFYVVTLFICAGLFGKAGVALSIIISVLILAVIGLVHWIKWIFKEYQDYQQEIIDRLKGIK